MISKELHESIKSCSRYRVGLEEARLKIYNDFMDALFERDSSKEYEEKKEEVAETTPSRNTIKIN